MKFQPGLNFEGLFSSSATLKRKFSPGLSSSSVKSWSVNDSYIDVS